MRSITGLLFFILLSLWTQATFSEPINETDRKDGDKTTNLLLYNKGSRINSDIGIDSNRVDRNEKVLVDRSYVIVHKGDIKKEYKLGKDITTSNTTVGYTERGLSATNASFKEAGNITLTIDSKNNIIIPEELVSKLDSFLYIDKNLERGLNSIESENEKNTLFRSSILDIVSIEVKKLEKKQRIEAVAYLSLLLLLLISIIGLHKNSVRKDRLYESLFALLLVASIITLIVKSPIIISLLL